MKTSIWDILTGVILLGILCMVGAFIMIMVNPQASFNPFPPSTGGGQQPVATMIVLPSATETSPGLPPTWTPAPTQEDTKAPANPGTLRASSTPMPTNTVLVLPSFTPSKTLRTGIGGGSCTIVYQDPADNSSKKKGETFDMRWTIKNTSKDPWRADSVDINFVSGDRMHSGNDARDFPYDVGPNGMLDLVVSMTAPSTSGSYVSNWRLVQGSKVLCSFFVTLRVP